MYGKKSQPPFNQFANRSNQLYEEEEYEEENSQPLIQQIDPNYEPNDREIKEYAIEELGMSLPEDEGLLYIAKEGLKAPLPPNWVPYQGRDGQVYYKHRITQEKTYDHPTDIEYKKKYLQQKEKMARTNLKSINMKQNLNINSQIGLGGAGMGNPSGLFGKISQSNVFGQPISQSHFGQMSHQLVKDPEYLPSNLKLDSKIEEQFQKQLEILEAKLKKQCNEFQDEEQKVHDKKIKRLKEQFDRTLDSIYKNSSAPAAYGARLKEEREKLKVFIEEDLNDNIQKQLKQFEKELEKTNKEFEQVYGEDNQIKIEKYRQDQDRLFEQREHKYNLKIQKFQEEKETKRRQKDHILSQLKKDVENSNNLQIEEATSRALNQEMRCIKQQWQNKLAEKKDQLEREYQETKKVLGYDINGYLSQLAQKKAKMKAMSLQKLQSLRKKQTQAVIHQFHVQYEKSIKQIERKLKEEGEVEIENIRKKEQEKLIKNKQKFDKQLLNKVEQRVNQIYEESGSRINIYQAQMNKKLTTLQNNFIGTMQNKSEEITKSLSKKMELKLKEQTIQNKGHLLQSMKRQLEIEKNHWKRLKFQRDLSLVAVEDLDDYFSKKAKQFEVQFKPEAFLKYEDQYKKLKHQYKKDKELLGSLMVNLQSSSHRLGKSHQLQSNMSILKQYNLDVRTMRLNEENLRKIEMLLKRVEINDKEAIQELDKNTQLFSYKDIQLRQQLNGHQLKQSPELGEMKEHQKQKCEYIGQRLYYPSNLKNVEATLKEHSRFLSTVKQDLNRKLYQVRNNLAYSIY